jgi:hypothetical protein
LIVGLPLDGNMLFGGTVSVAHQTQRAEIVIGGRFGNIVRVGKSAEQIAIAIDNAGLDHGVSGIDPRILDRRKARANRARRVQADIRGENAATVVTLHGPLQASESQTTVICNLAYAGNHLERECFPQTLLFDEAPQLVLKFW